MNATDIKIITLRMNDEDVKKKIDNLEIRLKNAKQIKTELEKKAATGDLTNKEAKALSKFTKEVEHCEKSLSKMRSTKQQVEKVLNNLSTAGPTELKNTLKALNKELESGAIERGSENWKKYQEAIKEVKTELRKIKDEQEEIGAGGKINKWLSTSANLWMTAQGVMAVFNSTMSAMQGYVDDFARMDDAMTQTKKYTGMTRQEVEELNEEFKKIDTATPREKLNALAADAGRLGIQSKDAVLEFVQAADLINIALGEDLGEDAVKNIGKLAQLFGDADSMGLKQAMLSTASTINELAQSSSASEGYIMNFTSRLAGVGKQAGMSQAQVMAFASVLDQNMVGCERGATALQNVIMKLYKEPQKMAKAAGMDVQKFTKLLQTDGNAALLQFIETLSKAGKIDALAPMFADMKVSGSGISQTLTTLASNIDTLRQTQEQATVAFRDGTSAEKEAASQRESAAYKLEKYKKEAHELSVELGSKLYPIFTVGMRTINALTTLISTLTSFISKHITTIGLVTGAIIVYTTAVNASIIADKAKVLWTERITVVTSKLWKVLKANPWGIVAMLIAGAVGMMIELNRETAKGTQLQRSKKKASLEAQQASAGEIAKLRALYEATQNQNLSMKQRITAVNKLKQQYPDYFKKLSNEAILAGKAAGQYRKLSNAILQAAQARAIEGEIERLATENIELENRKKELVKPLEIREKMLSDPKTSRYAGGGLGYAIREQRVASLEKRISDNTQTMKELSTSLAKMPNISITEDPIEEPPENPNIGSGSGNNKNDKLEKEHREKLKQLDAEAKELDRKLQETIQSYNVAFAEGKLDVDAYREKVLQAEMTTAMQQRDLYDKNLDWQVEKWKERNDKVLQLEKTQAEKTQAWTIAALEKNEQQELQVLEEKHSQGLISETAYQIERNAITLKYLRQREKYYRKWGRVEDYDKAHLAVEKEVARQRIELLKKVADTQKKVRDEYLSKHPIEQAKEELRIQKEIMNALLEQFKNDTDKQKEIAETWNKIIAQIEVRLKKLKKTEGSRVLSEAGYQSPSTGSAGDVADGMISAAKIYENYEETKNKLFRQISEREINPEEYSLAMEELEKLKYERIAGYATACYQTVSGAMQAASQLMQANYEIEAQKVEERYAREIAAAGEGTDKAKQLEARKQKELANLKNKYNKKAMAVEMAQAVAQTAVAAINAYASASKVAFWLGPVAAAAATAAGAIQIAAIAKQHETQSAGYYEGGFTGGQNYRREAGVVHEGEFVANHQAVKNPNLLPVLNMIDQAQRHNRVASLTAADVNRVAGGTAVAAAPQPVIIDSSSLRTAESIEKLNRMLEHPIKTYVVIDGPDGLHRNYQEYKKIIGEE